MRDFYFKPIPEFETYSVNREGIVLNSKNKIIKPWRHESQRGCYYMRVTLHGKWRRQNMRVHRAVAMAFIPNPEWLPEVNHIDGDSLNNHVSNLEWVSTKENAHLKSY